MYSNSSNNSNLDFRISGIYYTVLALKIPWTEEPGELQSTGSEKVRHDQMTKHTLYIEKYTLYRKIYLKVYLIIEHSSGDGSGRHSVTSDSLHPHGL